jgi:uncharacterized protein
MRIVFFLVILTVFGLINYYVLVRAWSALSVDPLFRLIFPVVLTSMFATFIFTMFLGTYLPIPVARVLSFYGNTFVVVIIYLLFSFLLVDIVRIFNHFLHFASPQLPVFRYWALVVSLLIIGLALIVGNYRFNHPQTVRLDISVDKPKQGKELKIVAVSDVHLGFSIDKKRLQRYVKMINDEHPDLVLMAGDISDRPVLPIIKQNMKEELSSIHAKYGVYAINGNHEYMAEKPLAMTPYLKESGIKVLRDEVALIDSGLYIIGRDDKMNPNRKSLRELVNGTDKSLPKILLDHQPFQLNEAQENGIDFQFSGHTHNGQFFPGNLFVNWIYELGYGYMKKGATHYYVSSGLGIWGPQYRIGTQSEMVVIRLKY